MSNRDETRLSTYSELADLLDTLPSLVKERRRRDRLSVRAAAEQAGCSFATLDRWERGMTGRSIRLVTALLRWLDQPPQPETDEPAARSA